jgi:hypothetical protein
VTRMTAHELLRIPIWKGNRILDSKHVDSIERAALGEVEMLDHGYCVVGVNEVDAGGNNVEKSYVVDGQHRLEVLRRYFESTLCAPDFAVLVTVKHVKDEYEIIHYFNRINHAKPIQFREPAMIVNAYLGALTNAFNGTKTLLIRNGRTCRPYMSADSLRDALTSRLDRLSDDMRQVAAFVERVESYNAESIRGADLYILGLPKKDRGLFDRGVGLGFVLGVDEKFKWLDACLTG